MSKSAAHVISGHTVVITGAASGIGRALAQRLSGHGLRLQRLTEEIERRKKT